MNEMVNRFLLVGDKFTPEMHLKHVGFIYSAFGTFTKNTERTVILFRQEMQIIFTKMI